MSLLVGEQGRFAPHVGRAGGLQFNVADRSGGTRIVSIVGQDARERTMLLAELIRFGGGWGKHDAITWTKGMPVGGCRNSDLGAISLGNGDARSSSVVYLTGRMPHDFTKAMPSTPKYTPQPK